MNTIPLGFSSLSQFSWRRLLWSNGAFVAAFLIAAGLLLPAARLYAQSESPEAVDSGVVQDPEGPGHQPTAEEIDAAAKPTFVISNVSFGLPAEHSTGAAAVPTTSKYGYQGTINYTCHLISETKSSSTPAECAMYPATAKLQVNGTVGPQILIFGKGTHLPSCVTLSGSVPSLKAVIGAGGAALACCLLFGVPARRRGWRALFSVLLLLLAVGGMSACVDTPKMITQGGYTFKVTGTDASNPAITSWGLVKVNVL